MLQNLHVLSNLLLTLYLFIKITLAQAFDSNEVTAEFMLRDAHLSKCPFADFVPNTVELVGCRDWLPYLLKVRHNHRDQVLFVLQ